MLWSRWTDPWADLRRMQRDMNRLFNGCGPARSSGGAPPLNLWQGKEDAVVSMEAPGVAPDAVDISVVGEELTVTGNREPEDLGEGGYVRHERSAGAFVRTVRLPFRADPNKVTAEMSNGVLRITLPRLEADKPRQIAVKSS